MQNHKYSLGDIEMMIPWEREIYVSLLVDQMKEEKQLREQRALHG